MFESLADPHRSQPTVSHHLRKLLDAGLPRREQRGVWAYYSLDRERLRHLAAVMDLQAASRERVEPTLTAETVPAGR
jgi:ArsR family transcriptional regulator